MPIDLQDKVKQLIIVRQLPGLDFSTKLIELLVRSQDYEFFVAAEKKHIENLVGGYSRVAYWVN